MEVSASTFKAHCLRFLEGTREHGTEIVITKRGKPIARLVPVAAALPPATVLGSLAGAGRSLGDIVGPTEAEWDLDP